MNYSYETNSYQSCNNCHCYQEIQLLQQKLTEVHGKLLQQIDICRRQEGIILDLELRAQETSKSSRLRDIYQTFGHQREKENQSGNRKYESQSKDSYQLKNELLQADLQAMRHRVLTEITEKNKLLEEMGDLKKKFRREMANEVKKFEGLEIIYRKMVEDRGMSVSVSDNSVKVRGELERVNKLLQECESKYQKEREKNRAIDTENRSLLEKIQNLEDERRKLQREPREKQRTINEETSQLREMDNLKQQISQINRNISQRQLQFNQRNQRRKNRSPSSPQDMARRQTMLVGQRWGKRPL